MYCRKLKPKGILVFHISNRYLNLEPMLAALAEKNNLVCLSRADFQLQLRRRTTENILHVTWSWPVE